MATTEDAIAVLPQPYVTAAGLKDEHPAGSPGPDRGVGQGGGTQLITGVTVVRKEYAEEHPDVVPPFWQTTPRA